MEYKIDITPTNQITVGQYVDFNEAKTKADKCRIATGLSAKEVSELPYSVVSETAKVFTEIINDAQPLGFAKIIELDGEQYGFEPNLNRIETGAVADLSHLEDLGVEKNLDKYLSILYRPITARWGANNPKYRIEPYSEYKGDAMDNADLFREYNLQKALGVCAFFLTLQKDLQNALEMTMLKAQRKAIQEMKEVLTS